MDSFFDELYDLNALLEAVKYGIAKKYLLIASIVLGILIILSIILKDFDKLANTKKLLKIFLITSAIAEVVVLVNFFYRFYFVYQYEHNRTGWEISIIEKTLGHKRSIKNAGAYPPISPESISSEYTARREVLDWYTSLATIRTHSADTVPASIVVDLALGYKQGDNAASNEINSRINDLNDFLTKYFAQKTYAELQPQYEEILKIEIRNEINGKILTQSKIRDVAFKQLDVKQDL